MIFLLFAFWLFPANSFAELDQATIEDARPGGLGISFSRKDDQVYVFGLVPGSPAHKSGKIEPGDILISTGPNEKEQTELKLLSVSRIAWEMRGEIGTEVVIRVVKKNDLKNPFYLKLVRQKINAAAVITQQTIDALNSPNAPRYVAPTPPAEVVKPVPPPQQLKREFPDAILVNVWKEDWKKKPENEGLGAAYYAWKSDYIKSHSLGPRKSIYFFVNGKSYQRTIKKVSGMNDGPAHFYFEPKISDIEESQFSLMSVKKLSESKHTFKIEVNKSDHEAIPTFGKVFRNQAKIAEFKVVDLPDPGEWRTCDFVVRNQTQKGPKTVKGVISPCDVKLFADVDDDGWPEIIVGGGNSAVTVYSIFPSVEAVYTNFGM